VPEVATAPCVSETVLAMSTAYTVLRALIGADVRKKLGPPHSLHQTRHGTLADPCAVSVY
jgi:hypothetical protein